MTQREEILKHLLEFPNSTTRQIQDSFDFPDPSIRRVLSQLRKEGLVIQANEKHINRVFASEVQRVEIELETGVKQKQLSEKQFRRKIVKTTIYDVKKPHRKGAPNKKKFALTYESNKTNREEELLNSLSIPDKNFYEFGYDDELVTKKPPHVYPHIEVGFE